jgi:hypothetical protein
MRIILNKESTDLQISMAKPYKTYGDLEVMLKLGLQKVEEDFLVSNLRKDFKNYTQLMKFFD